MDALQYILLNNVEQMQISISMVRGAWTLHNRQYHIDMLYNPAESHMTHYYILSVSGPDESSD